MEFGFPHTTPSSVPGLPAVCRLQPRCQTETIDRAVPGAMAVARTEGATDAGRRLKKGQLSGELVPVENRHWTDISA